MKNLVVLTDAKEIHTHVHGLWRSAPIRASHAEGGFIHDIVEQFASLPRLFCDSTDDRLERAHFCSWWGVTMNRAYDNPAIEDLYRLHEMFHAAFMPYFPGIGFDAFHRKMEDNELKASVCSEIRVYFELPHLREQAVQKSASISNCRICANRPLRIRSMPIAICPILRCRRCGPGTNRLRSKRCRKRAAT